MLLCSSFFRFSGMRRYNSDHLTEFFDQFQIQQQQDSMQQNTQTDLVMVRHAQSKFNEAVQAYVNKHSLIYDWQHLSKDQRFLKEVKYNIQHLDCDITSLGYQQCSQAKETIKDFHPDVILVSPMLRALRTCSEIFKGQTCPWIAQPLLTEAIRSSSDVNGNLALRKLEFPHVDFTKVEQLGDLWCLSIESQENKSLYSAHISSAQTPQACREALLGYMHETFIYETATHLRKTRIPLMKEMLREYRKKYSKIAVVSHYNIIRFTIATEFNNRDQPFHSHIGNCQVISRDIQKLPI